MSTYVRQHLVRATLALALALGAATATATAAPTTTTTTATAPATPTTAAPTTAAPAMAAPAATGTASYPSAANGVLSWANQDPSTSRHVMDGAPAKVYVVIWGSQWGTASTDGNGNTVLSGDKYGAAVMAQRFFKALGTDGETWSASVTQYCDSPHLSWGMGNCPMGTPLSQYVNLPTGGALAGVWYDNGAAAPAVTGYSDLQSVAVAAANHFGNTTADANAHAYYDILTPSGVNPVDMDTQDGVTPPSNGCAEHDVVGSGSTGGIGTVYYGINPYTMDMLGTHNPGADGTAGAGPQVCGVEALNGSSGMLDGWTGAVGHEWAETMTDPDQKGWINQQFFSPNKGAENGDECLPPHGSSVSWSPYLQNISFGAAGTFVMQALWSNRDGTCVFSDPVNQAPATPAGVTVPAPATGSVTVSATGLDPSTVGVIYKVDGNIVGDSTTAGFPYTLDTTTLSDGPHTITAEAANSIGTASADSTPVTFDVYNTPVYALSTDKSSILRWSGTGSGASAWTKIGGPATAIYDCGFGLVALNPNGSVSTYNRGNNTWTAIGGNESELAISDTHVYALSADRGTVSVWSGSGTTWNTIGGAAAHIYGGGDGVFATSPTDGTLSSYDFGNAAWTVIGGPAAEYAVSENHIYALSTDRSALSVWNSGQAWNNGTNGNAWTSVGLPSGVHAGHVFGGLAGAVLTDTTAGAAYLYNQNSSSWTEIGPAAGSYAFGNTGAYSLSADSATIAQWNGRTWSGGSTASPWTTIGGPAGSVVTGG